MKQSLTFVIVLVFSGLLIITGGCNSSSKPTIKVGDRYYFSTTSKKSTLFSCDECYSQWRIEIISDVIAKICSYSLDGPRSGTCCTEFVYSYDKKNGVFNLLGGYRNDDTDRCLQNFSGNWVLSKYDEDTKVFYSQNFKGLYFYVE